MMQICGLPELPTLASVKMHCVKMLAQAAVQLGECIDACWPLGTRATASARRNAGTATFTTMTLRPHRNVLRFHCMLHVAFLTVLLAAVANLLNLPAGAQTYSCAPPTPSYFPLPGCALSIARVPASRSL
jgi:hypothetical protein